VTPEGQLRELLTAERAGRLPPEVQQELTRMREAGEIGAPLPAIPAWQEPIERHEALWGRPPERVATGAKQAILPTVGGIAGAGAGALTGPFAPVAVPTLEAAGSAGGEALNQLLGITEPSAAQIGLAAAVPPVVRGTLRVAGPALKAGLRALPGAQPAVQEVATATVRKVPAVVQPAISEEAAWAPLRGQNPKLVAANFAGAVDELLARAQRAPGTENKQFLNQLRTIKATLDRYGNDVPFLNLDAYRRAIGEWTRSTDPQVANAGNRFYSAIWKDLETAATLPGQPAEVVSALKQAVDVSRATKHSEALGDIVEDLVKIQGGTLTEKIRPERVLEKIKANPMLSDPKSGLTPEALGEIRELLGSIKGLPTGPRSGQQLPWYVRGGAGGGLGMAVGLDPFLTGAAATVAPWAGRVVGWALESPGGRQLLRRALEAEGGELSARGAVALANALRAAERPELPAGPVRVGPIPGVAGQTTQ
jgi:hypothetical protein